MDYIRAIEQQQIKEIPEFFPGSHVKVHYRIKEGNRERIQVFEGDVIRRHGSSNRETFTVRKVSFGVEKLQENFDTLMDAIVKAKPSAAKGQYVRSCVVSATMGPGVKVSTSKYL